MRDIKPSKSISCKKKTEKKTKQTKLDNFLFNMSAKSLRYNNSNNNNNKWSYSQYFGLQNAQNTLENEFIKFRLAKEIPKRLVISLLPWHSKYSLKKHFYGLK